MKISLSESQKKFVEVFAKHSGDKYTEKLHGRSSY